MYCFIFMLLTGLCPTSGIHITQCDGQNGERQVKVIPFNGLLIQLSFKFWSSVAVTEQFNSGAKESFPDKTYWRKIKRKTP